MQYTGLLASNVENALLYTPSRSGGGMPKGLKQTSSLITISASVTETAPGAFTTAIIPLQLNPLDNEVFVIYGIDLDVQAPTLVPGLTTLSTMSISSTPRTTVGGIANNNVLAAARIETQDLVTSSVTNEFSSDSVPSTQLEYLAVLATNDFSINILGSLANATARTGSVRLFGVRARADSSIYAALVQSELLSA